MTEQELAEIEARHRPDYIAPNQLVFSLLTRADIDRLASEVRRLQIEVSNARMLERHRIINIIADFEYYEGETTYTLAGIIKAIRTGETNS